MCMQEAEIKNDIDPINLNFPGYFLEIETNAVILRTATYSADTGSNSEGRWIKNLKIKKIKRFEQWQK